MLTGKIRNMSGKELHGHLKHKVYPFFAQFGSAEGEGSEREGLGHISEYMQDADLEIKNESVLASSWWLIGCVSICLRSRLPASCAV